MFDVDKLADVIRNNLNLAVVTTTTAAASLALFYLYRGNRQRAMTELISLDNQTFEIEVGRNSEHVHAGVHGTQCTHLVTHARTRVLFAFMVRFSTMQVI